jgi:predicted DNA-binding transcriptional regulator AlpA
MKKSGEQVPSPFITPNELAERWQCARSSVDRIARRAGLKRMCLGEGKNGMVRFLRKEVEAYERDRII